MKKYVLKKYIHLSYTIIWKPIQFLRKKIEKNRKEYFKSVFKLDDEIFDPKNGGKFKTINPVDLIVSFLWPRITSQSEFPIKSYGRLNLRWSDFSFYFFCLSLFFLLSLSLSSLFLYMKTDEKGLVIHEILVFNFLFLER
jgi:hypothetical protein